MFRPAVHLPARVLALGSAGACVAALAAVAPATAAPARPAGGVTCHGLPATLVGTDGDDVLRGTAGRDVIAGLRGNDRIEGLGGDDVLCGNQGFDVLVGGTGDDRLLGGTNGYVIPFDADFGTLVGDRLAGGPGDDLLEPGDDPRSSLTGVSGGIETYDVLDFSTAASGVRVDLRRGTARGQGHDTVNAGRVQVLGTSHDDTLVAAGRAVRFVTGAGDDVLTGSRQGDVLEPDGESTSLRGVRRDPSIGRGGDDTVVGGTGPDRITGRGGDDLLRGGAGRDQLSWYAAGGTPRLLGGDGRDDLYSVPVRSHGRWVLDAGPGDHQRILFGVRGADTVAWDMGTGRVRIDGVDRGTRVRGARTATVLGGARDDRTRWTVTGTEDAERLYSEHDRTVFDALGGDDAFAGSRFVDTFDGGEGTDRYIQDGTSDEDNTCVSVEQDPRDACPPV